MQLGTLTLSLLDVAALIWFFVCSAGYNYYANTHPDSLAITMRGWREKWSLSMLQRDNRIVDTQVITGLNNVATFFCSTSIFITAGLFAAMGASEQIVSIINQLSFLQSTNITTVELKLGLLIIIFIYSFFKFGWAIKQHSYSAVVLAAVPPTESTNPERDTELAKLMGKLSNLGDQHFSDGIRAYYFALATISWFVHPLVYIGVLVWVVMVLHRRDFRSKLLKHLTETT
ncbi:MAG: hypothetical protein CSB47_02015 [Proteobacteria bacterium]|nr:MAG: hypothetical protein CSB47_02015 [Pseudomonadota bacterium]